MLTLRLLTRAMRDHWRLILLVTLLAGAAATIGDFVRKPSYESEAALLVNVERFNVSASRADDRQNMAALTATEAVTSEAESLRSRVLLERLADQLDPSVLESPPPKNPILRRISDASKSAITATLRVLRALQLIPPQNPRYDFIDRIASKLDVSTVRQAQVIRLSFRAGTPEGARLVLDKLIDVYRKRSAAQQLQRKETENFAEEASRLRDQLEQAEVELSELRARYGVSDIAAERNLIANRLNRLSMLIETDANGNPEASTAVEDSVTGDASATVADASNQSAAPQIAQLHSRLNALRIERAGEAAMYSSQDARVHALDDQIAVTEDLLRNETTALVHTEQRYRTRLDQLLDIEPRFSRLLRNISILSDSYDVYRKAAEDHEILHQQAAQVQIEVLDPPSIPYERRGPRRIVIILAGLGIGLLVGIGLAVLLGSGASGRGSSPSHRRADSSEPQFGAGAGLVTAFDSKGADL